MGTCGGYGANSQAHGGSCEGLQACDPHETDKPARMACTVSPSKVYPTIYQHSKPQMSQEAHPNWAWVLLTVYVP